MGERERNERVSLEKVHLVTDKADCARLFQRGASLSSHSKEPFNEGNLCRVSFDVHHLQSLSLHTSFLSLDRGILRECPSFSNAEYILCRFNDRSYCRTWDVFEHVKAIFEQTLSSLITTMKQTKFQSASVNQLSNRQFRRGRFVASVWRLLTS